MKALLLLAILYLTGSTVAWSQKISCGDAPKIQLSDEQKIKGDVQGKAQLFTKLLGNADLQGAVESSKTELYQQHQDVGKDEINLYFAWISCQTINGDSSLSSSDKINQWMAVYKSLLGGSGSSTTPAIPKKPGEESTFFVAGVKFSVKRLVIKGNLTSLIISTLNINKTPTRLALITPLPTLTDDEGGTGSFYSSEGLQICRMTVDVCTKQFENFFEVEPDFAVNIIIKFVGLNSNSKPSSASFSSRVLILNADSDAEPTPVSLAFPDIPFSK